MCNPELKDRIIHQLIVAGGEVCSLSASVADLKNQLGIASSNRQFKLALGSAIRDRLIVRHRCPMSGIGDDERPVTLRLPNKVFAVGSIRPYSVL